MTSICSLSRLLGIPTALGLLAAAVGLVACGTGDSQDSLGPNDPSAVVAVRVSPSAIVLETDQEGRFRGWGLTAGGDSVDLAVEWRSSGGAISSDGTFASEVPGTFAIIGRWTGDENLEDTATVEVVAPPTNLVRIIVSPGTATLASGGTQSFSALGKLTDSSTAPIGVTWTATGGAVDGAGAYTAGTTAGSFRVIASQNGGSLRDTAEVTITASRTGWYVAPNGSPANPGTVAAPWSMAYLLWDNAGGRTRPGDTVWVRAGTYSTALVGEVGENGRTSLAGSAGAPLIIRAYPGERVTLDGGLTINGADTWWWGFDFTYSGWTSRTSHQSGSWPTDIRGPLTSLTVHGARVKVINSTVHDLGGGIESWESASDAEIYGNLIYYTGWTGTDRGHGHATYTQSTSGLRKIRDNLSWDSFANGNIAYGSDAVHLRNVEFIGNAGWNHGSLGPEGTTQFLLGAGGSTENLTFAENVVYEGYGGASLVRFGYDPNANNRAYTIRDNYLAGGEPVLRVWNLTQSSFTGNTVYTPATCGGCQIDLQQNTAGYAWSGNTWHGATTGTGWGYNNAEYTVAGWKSATGLGNGDTFVGSAPGDIKIFVRPNLYEPGRANVAVINWSGAGSASLDLSGIGLKPGQAYEVRNAQNFYGAPVATGTGPGGATVPLGGLSKAAVAGNSSKQPVSTGTQFNAFVVVPK